MPTPFRIPILRRISRFWASAAAKPKRNMMVAIPMSVFKLASRDLLRTSPRFGFCLLTKCKQNVPGMRLKPDESYEIRLNEQSSDHGHAILGT